VKTMAKRKSELLRNRRIMLRVVSVGGCRP
jgi:hypothetical protein